MLCTFEIGNKFPYLNIYILTVMSHFEINVYTQYPVSKEETKQNLATTTYNVPFNLKE